MDVVPSKVMIYGYDFKVNTYTKKIKASRKKNWSTYIKEIEYTTQLIHKEKLHKHKLKLMGKTLNPNNTH
jgi:hypothetical protein